MGPHHPSTHGVFRMDVKLDGETVVDLQPVFGYLHRNHEKLAENMSYLSSMPFTDRLDYFNSMTNNWAYAIAAEKLVEIEIPERAEYLRVIMSELTRLVNHVSLVGFFVNDLGALGTPLLYAFREREKILDLFEQASGARMMCNYMRFGGVARELPDTLRDEDTVDFITDLGVNRLPAAIDELDRLLTNNEIVRTRCIGVGVLSSEKAIAYSAAGPLLRASGVPYDLRRSDPYYFHLFLFR